MQSLRCQHNARLLSAPSLVLLALAISLCRDNLTSSFVCHDVVARQRTAKCSPLLSKSSDIDNPTMSMPEPPPSSPSYPLYHLISQNRECRSHDDNNGLKYKDCKSIPLAGVYDSLSAKIFAQNGAPALFLSGFGVSASLLGLPDAGMTNLVEMEVMARNICNVLRGPECQNIIVGGKHYPTPLIVDGDTGYGGAPNMLRTISSLASAGAAAITIEDQIFPKKCTIAAGSKIQIVDRDEAIQRVKGSIGARDLYIERKIGNTDAGGPWIVARTDCRLAHGFEEVIERCLRFEELGAEIIYAENLQSVKEYEQLRACLDPRTVTIVAQVQETIDARKNDENNGKKPLLTVYEIGELGFDLALFGVAPLQCVVGALEATAKNFLGGSGIVGYGGDFASSQIQMADFTTVKRVVGFDELEDFETKFPCS